MSESDEPGPVARSRRERRQEWLERQKPTVEELKHSCRRHYWEHADVDPPDWWFERQPNYPEITGPSGDGESGPIPPEVDRSDLKAYWCRHCRQGCITPLDGPAEERECRPCFRIAD